jgi:hypothetical protein
MGMNDIYIRNYDDNGYNIEDMNVQIGKSKLKEYEDKGFKIQPFYFHIDHYENETYCKVNLKTVIVKRKNSLLFSIYISESHYHLNIIDFNNFRDVCCKIIYLTFQEQKKDVGIQYREDVSIPCLSEIKSHFENANDYFGELESILG